MDVRSGEILAMGSNPTFDPEVFTEPITQGQVNELYRDPVLSPLTNRAIAGAYPTGSTFKPITAIAALDERQVTTTEPIYDDGVVHPRRHRLRKRRRRRLRLDLDADALQVSSDVFYYTLGDRMNGSRALQDWAHRLGHRPRERHRPARRAAGSAADPGLAQPALPRKN